MAEILKLEEQFAICQRGGAPAATVRVLQAGTTRSLSTIRTATSSRARESRTGSTTLARGFCRASSSAWPP
jgi:hypothetical protein